MLALSSIAALPPGGMQQPQGGSLSSDMQKDIISYCKYQVDSYYRSQVFQNWKMQSEAIVDAVEQRWRTNEQVTRSGFYLAALRAEYDGLKEGAVNIFAKANPLFIFRKKPGFEQSTADKIQQHVGDEWDTMDGLEKFLEITDDTWTHGVGISYTKWSTVHGYGQFPVVVPQVWGGTMIDWQEGYNVISSGPDLERIHPMNWAGDYRKNRGLTWESCMREWRVSDFQCLKGDPRYLQEGVEASITTMREGKQGNDPNFFHPFEQGGNASRTSTAIVYEYWGDLTGVKGFEDDPHEYVVMWTEDRLLRFNHNPIYIGGERFRPFNRTRSNPLNNFPMGRSILGPNLTHQKLMNLMVNLMTDDQLIRQHLGIAVWADAMENTNDLTNPEGARGFVWMKNNSSQNQIPRFIGEGQSGIIRDGMDFMDRFIMTDMQKSGLNNTSQGLKEGAQNGTATAAQLQASMGNRKIQAAYTQVCRTGLRPIAKHITLLTLRNRQMQDLQQFSNEEQLAILAGNSWDIHDSITQDPYQEAMNKAEFYNMAKDVIMQITSANGDASHVVEMLRDIARDKGIKPDDFNRYFPLAKPPQVGQPPAPGGALPAQATPNAKPPMAPAQPAPPPIETPLEEAPSA